MKCFVIDNGASHIKFGLSEDESNLPRTIYNATAKHSKTMQHFVGNSIRSDQNASMLQFSRPFERGYLVNWQYELEIWSSMIGSLGNTQDQSLILTEPPCNPTAIQNDTNEIAFEYFGFKQYLRKPAFCFSAYGFAHDNTINNTTLASCTVIDSGFSFSHITPFLNGQCQKRAVIPLLLYNISGARFNFSVQHLSTGQACKYRRKTTYQLLERGG